MYFQTKIQAFELYMLVLFCTLVLSYVDYRYSSLMNRLIRSLNQGTWQNDFMSLLVFTVSYVTKTESSSKSYKVDLADHPSVQLPQQNRDQPVIFSSSMGRLAMLQKSKPYFSQLSHCIGSLKAKKPIDRFGSFSKVPSSARKYEHCLTTDCNLSQT